ncbi:hypothetical protein [Silvibacterium acidisoli]|uniref:hypothetical protein n=1 Tax=Acidobacteriaceae bacterium ZG23-2 TaxID=2883246 RepID=UPI00406CC862
MAMWTEYEGTTIGSGFPLTKLLQPEGRSALFSTLDEKGSVKILRLIESHFDEDEILARWKGVAALNHPNLLRLEDYGKVSLDDTILVYAVMEPADANLGEVLVNQRLTPTESRQLAESVASALEALHSQGFVHEHVEPASILAVGEAVKLRSDCIREAPEGAEGQARKQRDVQNLCTVLLMALTQQRTLEAAGFLPAPFDGILARGLRGELGTAEIIDAFRPKPAEPAPAPVEAPTVSQTPAAAPAPARVAAAPARVASLERETYGENRSTARAAVIGGGVLVILLCAWLVWRIFHHSPAASAPAAPAVVVEPASTPAQAPQPVKAKPSPAAAPAAPAPVAADNREGWRVIAYTYNREDQARHKAETVAQQHPDLNAQVFSPTGGAPYFVSLGGVMNRDQAFAFSAKAHREGMPHDVYARHYHGR